MTGIPRPDTRTDAADLLQSAQPVSEPSRRRWFIPTLLLLIVASIPWYRRASEAGDIVAGLPAWVWFTLACSIGISVLTAFTAVLFWRDGAED